MPHLPLPPGDADEVERVWMINPTMGITAATFSGKVYANTRLPPPEREMARMRVAQINGCVVCQDTRSAALAGDERAEERYARVAEWASPDTAGLYSERERLAIECAERFCLDPRGMDQEFFDRLRAAYDDAEILDLLVCISAFMATGRLTAVLDVSVSCPIVLDQPAPT